MRGALPHRFLRSRRKLNLVFRDHASPKARERRLRVRSKLGLEDVPIPRYHWQLSSDGFVDSDDVYEHVVWIFERLQRGQPLSQLLGPDYEYGFSVFWPGNGPLITLKTAELLVRHKAEMGVAFYVEPQSRDPLIAGT